ncbi:MAG TPA: alpha-ketoacid dehydrogenase subunit beta, partial [Pseudoxanthomonas sp.]|nr:alpha-ketoacid dehydrogenase subunit beta [Pseudoxanthomonas sp.]
MSAMMKSGKPPVGAASAATASANVGAEAPPTANAITLIEAITQALAWELKHDDSVLILGEDVGVNGGVFRA